MCLRICKLTCSVESRSWIMRQKNIAPTPTNMFQWYVFFTNMFQWYVTMCSLPMLKESNIFQFSYLFHHFSCNIGAYLFWILDKRYTTINYYCTYDAGASTLTRWDSLQKEIRTNYVIHIYPCARPWSKFWTQMCVRQKTLMWLDTFLLTFEKNTRTYVRTYVQSI